MSVDESKIKEGFASSYKDQVSAIADSQQHIGSVTITNHPRWRRQLPDNKENIDVVLR